MKKRKPRAPKGYKRCRRCEDVKLLAEFGSDKSRPDGFDPYCRVCRRDVQHEIREHTRGATDETKQRVYSSLTTVERDALKRTVEARTALSSLHIGAAISIRLANGQKHYGSVTGSSPAYFSISGAWGSSSYTLAEMVMGEVEIVKGGRKGATKEPCSRGRGLS